MEEKLFRQIKSMIESTGGGKKLYYISVWIYRNAGKGGFKYDIWSAGVIFGR